MALGLLRAALIRTLRDAPNVLNDSEHTTADPSQSPQTNLTTNPDHPLSNVTDTTWPWSQNYPWDYTNGSLANESDLLGDNESLVDSYNGSIDILEGYPYPSLYSWTHIILSSLVVTVIMLVIVFGNLLVIVAVATDRNLNGVQNWFITSLAVSDLFVGLFIMPLSLANELMGYWWFGNILCELWLAIDVLLCTASILNLCLISLDRYWSVTRAVSYVKTRTRKRAIIMIAIVWAMSMIICLPPLVGWKRPQPTKFGYPLCVLSEEPGYVAYSTMGSFYIPLIVMVLVYFKIYLAARSRARRNLKKKPPKHIPENGKSMSTTTTSFSNPAKTERGRLSPTKEYSSEDEDPSASVSGQHSSQSGSKGSQAGQVPDIHTEVDSKQPRGEILLSVTNHHVLTPGTDDKRKLLSGEDTYETDSTVDRDLPNRQRNGSDKGRHIHFSEDTDSHSDLNSSSLQILPSEKGYRNDLSGEENVRPLLEESDSQRDSDRNSNSLAHGHSADKSKSGNITTDSRVSDTTGDEGTQISLISTHNRDSSQSGPNQKQFLKTPHAHHHASHSPKRSIITNLSKKSTKEGSKPRPTKEDPERFKRKIAKAKERRATLVLGIIMATFIGCWLPFFSIYLVVSFAKLSFPPMAFAVFFWFGYVNSALNPIIYTIFNRDFKNAFHKIIFGRRNTF